MKTKFVSSGLVFGSCLWLVSVIQAETIVAVPNGDFSLTSSVTVPASGHPDGATVQVPTNWTYTADPDDAVYTNVSTVLGTRMWTYGAGNWGYGDRGTATLEQDSTALVQADARAYTLTFTAIEGTNDTQWASSNQADLTVDFLVNGSSVASKVISFTADSGTPSLTTYSLTWLVNTTGELGIRFHFEPGVGANAQIGIGTVGLSYASVPEPSIAVLLVTGLTGLLAYAWRKRKN